MKIYTYWAKSQQSALTPRGQAYALATWQGSDMSQEDAQRRANARIAELVRKVQMGKQLDRYSYGERALREEVARVLPGRTGGEAAILTRNSYGALVINAANALFADIDFAESEQTASGGLLGRLFGRASQPDPAEIPLQRIRAWWEQHREVSLRVYRTFAGLRCLITSHVFDPTRQDTLGLLAELDSDPLYVRLCRAQGCFRARVTPKPWRCGADAPPSRYPWDTGAAEARYRRWEQAYTRTVQAYATCRLVAELGAGFAHPDVAPVLDLHDGLARVQTGLPLA